MRLPKNILKKTKKKNLLPLDLVVRFLKAPQDLTALSLVNKNAYSTISELKFHIIRNNEKQTKAESFRTIVKAERREARIIRCLNGCHNFFQSRPVKLSPTLLGLAIGTYLLKTSCELLNRLEPHHSVSREYVALSLTLGTAMISYAIYWLLNNMLKGASYLIDDEHQYRFYKHETNSIKSVKLETPSTRNP